MTWTSPRTWVAGETVTAALMNTHVRDNLKAIGDAWAAYTVTLTNGSNGNGTLAGAYTKAGVLVFWRVRWTLGSTSSITGTLNISLPVTSAIQDFISVGQAYLNDNSVATDAGRKIFGTAVINSGTAVAIQGPTGGDRVTGTVQGMYEAA